MTFKGASGKEQTVLVQKTDGPAVFQGEHNKESSIRSFARACFQYAIDTKQDLWFSTKDTIAKVYDGAFKRIFEEEYEKSYKVQFEALGLRYFYTLIDDAVARVIRSEGGFIWACKNYDGDVMSDMVATAFGSLAMMTSVLVAPDGTTEYEAAHGTITRHYYRYLKGEQTSTNPMATIFAWTGALRKRGQLDGLPALASFADKLERASLDTIRSGVMTGDLAGLVEGERPVPVTSEAFFESHPRADGGIRRQTNKAAPKPPPCHALRGKGGLFVYRFRNFSGKNKRIVLSLFSCLRFVFCALPWPGIVCFDQLLFCRII